DCSLSSADLVGGRADPAGGRARDRAARAAPVRLRPTGGPLHRQGGHVRSAVRVPDAAAGPRPAPLRVLGLPDWLGPRLVGSGPLLGRRRVLHQPGRGRGASRPCGPMTTDGAGPGQRFAPNFLLELFNNPLDPGYGDAARRQAEFGPRPPWRRRGAYAL